MEDRLLQVIKVLGLNTKTDDIVFILYNYPQISAEWLIRGKGSMFLCEPVKIKKTESLTFNMQK